MSRVFRIGDICIGQNFLDDVEYNGMECVVIGGLERREYLDQQADEDPIWSYEIEWETRETSIVAPLCLRLKKPDDDDANTIVSWEELPWLRQLTVS